LANKAATAGMAKPEEEEQGVDDMHESCSLIYNSSLHVMLWPHHFFQIAIPSYSLKPALALLANIFNRI